MERRRPSAKGLPVVLADGESWLLANPVFQAGPEGLTRPMVDQPLDNLFERAIRGEDLEIAHLFEVAKELLIANYELSNEEVGCLLEFASGTESRKFFECFISGHDWLSFCSY